MSVVAQKNVPFELTTPPVVEVAVTTHFLPSDNAPFWNRDTAFDFLDGDDWAFSNEEGQELRIEHKITLPNLKAMSKEAEGKLEHRLMNVLRHDNEKIFSLEIGQDYFTLTFHRKGEEYPGFSQIMEKWSQVFCRYRSFFQPEFVSRLLLMYVDNVPLIPDKEGKIELEEYFHFRPEYLDDKFGSCVHFEQKALFEIRDKKDHALFITFKPIPREKGQDERIFQINWQYLINYSPPKELKIENVQTDLNFAKEYIIKQFKTAFFTPKAWSTFTKE